MWLCNSSIGRKVVMSITGVALVLFLTFHGCMNVVALISAEGYNWICEMLGANWYAVAGTVVLAALVVIHFVYALILTLQNRKARGNNRYAVTDKPGKVEWASQNMFVLGLIVVLGLILHLENFWGHMMLPELIGADQCPALPAPGDGYGHIVRVFHNPIYVVVYIIWLVALWFHLTHGFWSAMQTLGWSGHLWLKRWQVIGNIYSTLVVLLFVVVVLAFALCGKCLPLLHDYNPCPGSCPTELREGCPAQGPQQGAPCCGQPAPEQPGQPGAQQGGPDGAPAPGQPGAQQGGPDGAPAPGQPGQPGGQPGQPAPQTPPAPSGAPAPPAAETGD